MICTNNKKYYEKCKSLRNLSFSKSFYDRFNHDDIAWNYRMSNLQAALGCGQLKNINWIIKRKREIGNKYYSKLKYKEVLRISQKAYKILKCRGIARCDFRFYKNKFFLLEVNTQPGMTSLSLVPEIAEYKNISFLQLVNWMVKDASLNR